jgi:hypothetical protein
LIYYKKKYYWLIEKNTIYKINEKLKVASLLLWRGADGQCMETGIMHGKRWGSFCVVDWHAGT